MSATIIDGKAISKAVQATIKEQVEAFHAAAEVTPVLAAVLVGEDPASHVYVRNKERACKRVGITSQLHRVPKDCSTTELLEIVNGLNRDDTVSGILVQLPLPSQIDSQQVLDAIDPRKDVDGFHPENVGLLSQGRPRFLPCTPAGIIQMLAHSNLPTAGKRACIVGRSDIVGKPLALMLAQRDSAAGPDFANATVTLCHSRTENLAEVTREAELLIAAIGRPDFITSDMIRPGAVVIDVGINRVDDGLVGDVEFDGASRVASAITPVPGGVGPMTVTMLLANTLTAAKMAAAAV